MDNEKISKYVEELQDKLQELKEERQEILKKVDDGKVLSLKDNIRNKRLASQIKDIQDKLKKFDELNVFDEMVQDLHTIRKVKTTKAEKTEKINNLLAIFAEWNEKEKEDFLNNTNLLEEDLEDLEKVKDEATKEIEDLKIELRLAKRRNLRTSDIEEDIDNNKNLIEEINNYQTNCLDLLKIKEDLEKIANNSTTKEDKVVAVAKYITIIEGEKEIAIKEFEELIEDDVIDVEIETEEEKEEDLENKEENKKSLKERTKEKLKVVGDFFNKNRKKIIAIGSTAVLCVTIILVAKSCSKDINNSKNDNDLNDPSKIEQLYNNVNKDVVNSLVKKGYSEYAAMLMAENFDEKTINTLKNVPYIEIVENYATEKEFNLDYINDYENARNTYNLTSDKSVDFVNRSYKIQETGFYDDATINDIVGVTKAIEEQKTFRKDGNLEDQTINNSLTEIYNSYMFTADAQDKNIQKIEALKYFAKEGTDLDLFLTEYATLVQNVLSTKGNAEESAKAKQRVYNYLDIFANTFAGNKYDVANLNENAVVEDTYDWNIAFQTFIAPLISTFITEDNVNDFICLQTNMLSNYEMWIQINLCDTEEASLTLGGR